ncbi:hypothetical protein KMW28_22725 [Flammeovirga yaeyamensis]|uniref:Neuromedin U n=1 Tax=Flammeovirga yaeyamensis TaxID=367791 RepID=A0AAX1NFD3_9BACT|nr:neuromedin U [Flammeovirga yaeyamensis]MBB3696823.1 hypothetical protein [Flammeovirga yaeyamensis]NMF33488.1 transporter [Flammeovirga yaeyamensis]QWG05238.1 hypothetical protein KMW28_22725 [Flammeovirga yaeyamensis]
MKKSILLLSIIYFVSSQLIKAQKDELAAKLQNPLANIIALPVQHNFGVGSPVYEGTVYSMSLQPIIANEHKHFNLIHRGVFAVSHLPATAESESITGVSDLNYSFFLSPKKTGKLAWGVGPSIDMPTASNDLLGTGKWGAGAAVVMVYQTPKWTFDMVVRQTFSFGGDANRDDVHNFVCQALTAYGIGNGWVVNTFPTITANWNADKGQKWTVPLGGGFNKLVFVGGKVPVNIGAQYYHNVVRPDNAPKGEFRIVTTIVLRK